MPNGSTAPSGGRERSAHATTVRALEHELRRRRQDAQRAMVHQPVALAYLDAPGDQRPATIFATAYDDYAVRAFDVHAIDYVRKPVEPGRRRARAPA